MSTQILGIGVGSFILLNIWILVLILCLVAIRTKKIIGVIAFITGAIVTVVLILIPKSSNNASVVYEEKDYNFIWHNILAAFLGLCAIGSIALFITEHAIQPIQTTQIRSWIIE